MGDTAAGCDSLPKTVLRWCLGASWKAQAELRDTNCQGAKRQLVDDQVGPAVALGARISAWPLFPLCNRNPPDPEPKRGVGRRVERKVKGRVKVTFPGWVCLEPQVSGFLLKWRLIFHTGRGLWFGLSGEHSPVSHSQATSDIILCKQHRVGVLLDSLLRAHASCGPPWELDFTTFTTYRPLTNVQWHKNHVSLLGTSSHFNTHYVILWTYELSDYSNLLNVSPDDVQPQSGDLSNVTNDLPSTKRFCYEESSFVPLHWTKPISSIGLVQFRGHSKELNISGSKNFCHHQWDAMLAD